jgi:hypothetical protein
MYNVATRICWVYNLVQLLSYKVRLGSCTVLNVRNDQKSRERIFFPLRRMRKVSQFSNFLTTWVHAFEDRIQLLGSPAWAWRPGPSVRVRAVRDNGVEGPFLTPSWGEGPLRRKKPPPPANGDANLCGAVWSGGRGRWRWRRCSWWRSAARLPSARSRLRCSCEDASDSLPSGEVDVSPSPSSP